MMAGARIVLAGLGSSLSGLTWEADRVLRIGRQANLDVVLRDSSVARVHAEIRNHGLRWCLRDVADDPMYPTLVNQQPLCAKELLLRANDLIQIGKAQLKVMRADVEAPAYSLPAQTRVLPSLGPNAINTTGAALRLQATAQHSWDEAMDQLTHGSSASPPPHQAMQTLVRPQQRWTDLSQMDGLLSSILKDAIAALHAQRGSILLADPGSEELTLRATQTSGTRRGGPGRPYSRTLVRRCFQMGESMLCQDDNMDKSMLLARPLRPGAIASVICALLRTPNKRLGVLHLDRGFLDEPFTENDLHLADAIAASVAVGIETAQLIEQQRAQITETVTMLARAVQVRDQYTGDHAKRVADYSLMVAEHLQLPAEEKYHLQIGTSLYDIGKMGIDDAVLRKPGKLTQSEFEHVKTHPIKGATMLEAMLHLAPMVPIVRHHHECWDGSGYPDGLTNEQIPVTARIVAVADAFDAMTSARPYRPALPTEQAFLELIAKAGSHFDPTCVYAFMRARARIEAMLKGS